MKENFSARQKLFASCLKGVCWLLFFCLLLIFSFRPALAQCDDPCPGGDDDCPYGQVCGSNGCCTAPACFEGNTLVTTVSEGEVGEEKIKDLKVGDQVASFNAQTGSLEHSEVVDFYRSTAGGYFVLKFDNGREVKVTSEHPFLVEKDSWRDFVKAAELEVGETIFVLDKNCRLDQSDCLQAGKLIEKRYLNQPLEVYNLTVDKNNTFFANGLAVHNKQPHLKAYFYWDKNGNGVHDQDASGQYEPTVVRGAVAARQALEKAYPGKVSPMVEGTAFAHFERYENGRLQEPSYYVLNDDSGINEGGLKTRHSLHTYGSVSERGREGEIFVWGQTNRGALFRVGGLNFKDYREGTDRYAPAGPDRPGYQWEEAGGGWGNPVLKWFDFKWEEDFRGQPQNYGLEICNNRRAVQVAEFTADYTGSYYFGVIADGGLDTTVRVVYKKNPGDNPRGNVEGYGVTGERVCDFSTGATPGNCNLQKGQDYVLVYDCRKGGYGGCQYPGRCGYLFGQNRAAMLGNPTESPWAAAAIPLVELAPTTPTPTPTPSYTELGCISDSLTVTGLGMLKRNDILLDLDISDSMNTNWPLGPDVSREQCYPDPDPDECRPKIESAKGALKTFVSWINPLSDQMALETFHYANRRYEIDVNQAFTGDYNLLVDGIDDVASPSGDTPSLFSLERAVGEFASSGRSENEVEDRYIVMATDGQQNAPFLENTPRFYRYLYGPAYDETSYDCANIDDAFCPGPNGLVGDLRDQGAKLFVVAVGSYEYRGGQFEEIIPDGAILAAAAVSDVCLNDADCVANPQNYSPPDNDGDGKRDCLPEYGCFWAESENQLNEVMSQIRGLIQGSTRLAVLKEDVTEAKLFWSYRTRWENTIDDRVVLMRDGTSGGMMAQTDIAGSLIGNPPVLGNSIIGVNNLRPYTLSGAVPAEMILNQGAGLYVSDLGVIPYPPPPGVDLASFGGGEGIGLMGIFDLGIEHWQTLEVKEFNKYLVPASGGAEYGSYNEARQIYIFDLCKTATNVSACLNHLKAQPRHVQLSLMIAGRDPAANKESRIFYISGSSQDQVRSDLEKVERIELNPANALNYGFRGNSMNVMVYDSARGAGSAGGLPQIPAGSSQPGGAPHRYVGIMMETLTEDATLAMASLETACQAGKALSDGELPPLPARKPAPATPSLQQRWLDQLKKLISVLGGYGTEMTSADLNGDSEVNSFDFLMQLMK